VVTPSNDDTLTSCHNKYVTITVSKGPIHRKGINTSDVSNRFTSFDIKFNICPVEVWFKEFTLSRSALNNMLDYRTLLLLLTIYNRKNINYIMKSIPSCKLYSMLVFAFS